MTAIAATIWLTLAVSACGSAGDDRPLSIGPEDARRAAAGIYVGSGRLWYVEQQLISRCMRKAGFDYQVLPQGPDRTMRTDYSDDVAKARATGYGLLDQIRAGRRVMALEESEAGESAARDRALTGPPGAKVVRIRSTEGDTITSSSVGCGAEAWTELYGSVAEALQFTEFQANTVYGILYSAREDSEATNDAFDRWKECMEKRGYPDLEERDSAQALAYGEYDRGDDAAARSLELKIAEADALCDQESGYTSAAVKAENAALARFITDHEAEMAGFQEIQRNALAIARGVVNR
ncbi:MAG: hypothetical protein ACRCYU_15550 [Nocardioides sp.]